MIVTNVLAYYDTTTITSVKSLTVQALVTVSSGLLKPLILALPESIMLKLAMSEWDKCFSLLQYGNNYGCKKFNIIGPGDSVRRLYLNLNLWARVRSKWLWQML